MSKAEGRALTERQRYWLDDVMRLQPHEKLHYFHVL